MTKIDFAVEGGNLLNLDRVLASFGQNSSDNDEDSSNNEGIVIPIRNNCTTKEEEGNWDYQKNYLEELNFLQKDYIAKLKKKIEFEKKLQIPSEQQLSPFGRKSKNPSIAYGLETLQMFEFKLKQMEENPTSFLGIDALRKKIVGSLLHQIKTQLPLIERRVNERKNKISALRKEIESTLVSCDLIGISSDEKKGILNDQTSREVLARKKNFLLLHFAPKLRENLKFKFKHGHEGTILNNIIEKKMEELQKRNFEDEVLKNFLGNSSIPAAGEAHSPRNIQDPKASNSQTTPNENKSQANSFSILNLFGLFSDENSGNEIENSDITPQKSSEISHNNSGSSRKETEIAKTEEKPSLSEYSEQKKQKIAAVKQLIRQKITGAASLGKDKHIINLFSANQGVGFIQSLTNFVILCLDDISNTFISSFISNLRNSAEFLSSLDLESYPAVSSKGIIPNHSGEFEVLLTCLDPIFLETLRHKLQSRFKEVRSVIEKEISSFTDNYRFYYMHKFFGKNTETINGSTELDILFSKLKNFFLFFKQNLMEFFPFVVLSHYQRGIDGLDSFFEQNSNPNLQNKTKIELKNSFFVPNLEEKGISEIILSKQFEIENFFSQIFSKNEENLLNSFKLSKNLTEKQGLLEELFEKLSKLTETIKQVKEMFENDSSCL